MDTLHNLPLEIKLIRDYIEINQYDIIIWNFIVRSQIWDLPLPTCFLGLGRCNWFQSLCPVSGCSGDSTSSRSLASSTWQLNSHRLSSPLGNNRTNLKPKHTENTEWGPERRSRVDHGKASKGEGDGKSYLRVKMKNVNEIKFVFLNFVPCHTDLCWWLSACSTNQRHSGIVDDGFWIRARGTPPSAFLHVALLPLKRN